MHVLLAIMGYWCRLMVKSFNVIYFQQTYSITLCKKWRGLNISLKLECIGSCGRVLFWDETAEGAELGGSFHHHELTELKSFTSAKFIWLSVMTPRFQADFALLMLHCMEALGGKKRTAWDSGATEWKRNGRAWCHRHITNRRSHVSNLYPEMWYKWNREEDWQQSPGALWWRGKGSWILSLLKTPWTFAQIGSIWASREGCPAQPRSYS